MGGIRPVTWENALPIVLPGSMSFPAFVGAPAEWPRNGTPKPPTISSGHAAVGYLENVRDGASDSWVDLDRAVDLCGLDDFLGDW